LKLRELFYGLGFRPKVREYGWHEAAMPTPLGELRYAVWHHPHNSPAPPSAAAFNAAAQLLKPGDVAIDIGAHAGDTTIPMAAAVGPTGQVFGLEPNPYVYKILAANASLNPSVLKIVPLPYAAMEEDGEVEFSYGDPGFCNGGAVGAVRPWKMRSFFKVSVAGRNIANLLSNEYPDALARLAHVKIDTEGHDYAVFRSLLPIIEERRPSIRSEIHRFMPLQDRNEYLQALQSAGYECFVALPDDSADIVGERVTEQTLAEGRHFDVLAFARGQA